MTAPRATSATMMKRMMNDNQLIRRASLTSLTDAGRRALHEAGK